jgi:hypothetical protein
MEEGYKVAKEMDVGSACDAPIPAESVDETEKVADSEEKMEDENVKAEDVEKEEMNVSVDNKEKEVEMNVSEMKVNEMTSAKQEEIEPPVSGEVSGDAATEEEQKQDNEPESEIPTAPEEETEQEEMATEGVMETSVATDEGEDTIFEDAAEELAEESETSSTTVIENPAATTKASSEVETEKVEEVAVDVQRVEGDVSLGAEFEKESMECYAASAREEEIEATPDNIEQLEVHTPEKEELVEEGTKSPGKEDVLEKTTTPLSKAVEFSSPESCPGMDHDYLMMDSDIAAQNSDAEAPLYSFEFQMPQPVRLFENETPSKYSSNMSLDSIDDRCCILDTEVKEKMPQNGGGDADEVS